jgi:hypothetical protein
MMIPIWAWNPKIEKYEAFPIQYLETLGDGTQGFSFKPQLNNYARGEAFMQFRHCFELNPLSTVNGVLEYRLRKQL